MTYALLAAFALALALAPHLKAELADLDWPYYGADASNSKFSRADLIDSANVDQLRMIWRWPAPDWDITATEETVYSRHLNNRCTPIVVDGVMYIISPLNIVAALDVATGEELWTFDPQAWKHEQGWNVSRGLTYWRDGSEARIIFSTLSDFLFSLDAATGLPDTTFGAAGLVDLGIGLSRPLEDRSWYGFTSPPVVCRDVIVVGSFIGDYHYGPPPEYMIPGDVRGYDVRSGELLWTFHSPPQEGEEGVETWGQESWKRFGGGNAWSALSADEELGYVYLPLSEPSHDFYGGERPGDNLYSNSIVCLDARTGRRVWHFQIAHHGLWNYDLPAAPILLDITVDGKPIKAVAQLTKQAFCFVFDRTSGEPVWPIHEQSVPASTVVGERASPTQPIPSKPLPYDRQGVTVDDLIDFTPELRRQAIEIIDRYDHGPLYTPPSERGAMMLPGPVGGSNWVGGALHPDKGWLYIPSFTLPAVSRVGKLTDPDAHSAYEGFGQDMLSGPEGLPLTKPPYGRVTAIDLNTGEHMWQVAVGKGPVDHPALRGLDLPPLGRETLRHVFATPTLLFVTSEPVMSWRRYDHDYYIDPEVVLRAYNLDDGRLVAEVELPASPFGNPMTYIVDGRQFVGLSIGGRNGIPEYIGLAVPRPGEKLPPQGYSRDDAEHPAYYTAVEAIDLGDLHALRDLLAAHPDLATARGYLDELYEHPEFRGATLLHHVAGNPIRSELHENVLEITQALLEAGSDANATTIEGATPFTLVIEAEQPGWLGIDTQLIKRLIAAGADLSARRGHAMWYAVSNGKESMVELLLAHGAALDLGLCAALNRVADLDSFVASDGKLTDAAGSLYRPGLQVNERWDEQQILTAALSLAADNNSMESARWLLEHGAAVNTQVAGIYHPGDKGSTPLHRAASAGHIGLIQLLLDHGADPTLGDMRYESTPRVWARYGGQDGAIGLLKEAEEQWNAR